jgi:hypothetical protein
MTIFSGYGRLEDRAKVVSHGRARWSCTQEQPTGGVRPNASENEQISPTTTVPVARGVDRRRIRYTFTHGAMTGSCRRV